MLVFTHTVTPQQGKSRDAITMDVAATYSNLARINEGQCLYLRGKAKQCQVLI